MLEKSLHPARRVTLCALILSCCPSLPAAEVPPPPPEKISYWKQVRPFLQVKCHGCHQPAKAKGDFVMTIAERLLKGGEDGPGVVPGNPGESHVIKRVSLAPEAEGFMPSKGDPLTPEETELLKKWIAEGAVDDTAANAKQRIDQDHPPIYRAAPDITSLDFSPDGSLLAVAGFHEVFLCAPDGSSTVARLIGLSDKITTVRFSPDGKFLAAAGGQPARMGEIQVWNVAERKLALSVPTTYDTVYGVNWSPDGTLISFGCADKSVRAIDATSGAQKLFMASHDDWIFDTVFSTKGDHIISVGRDMTTKLTEVATQRFMDNLTSITPGALKGGLAAIARHPLRDEVLVGGADGVPQIYRMVRLVQRKIGDNSNLIKKFPALEGRIFSVDYSADGKRIAAGSSLDGRGEVRVFNADFDTSLPDNIKAIYGKVADSRSPEEIAAVEKLVTEGAVQISLTPIPTGIYTVSFSPDGTTLAAAGQDGKVRLIDPATGAIKKEFIPAPLQP